MLAYRLCSPKYADDPLSGEGARRGGGRWNSPGRPLVYAALNRATAAFEMLVHLQSSAILNRYMMIELDIPDSMSLFVADNDLPVGWDAMRLNTPAQQVGDDWLQQKASLALVVPSVALRGEKNMLISPVHPDISKAVILSTSTFGFDRRLHKNP